MTQKMYYIDSKDLLCECTVIKQEDNFYYLENKQGVTCIKAKTDCFETAKEAIENQLQKNIDQINLIHDRNTLLYKQIR